MNGLLKSLAVSCFGVSLIAATCNVQALVAAEPSGWSEFHGDSGQGYVAEGQIPSEWSDEDYVWRRDLGSRDVGSPVVVGEKVFYLRSLPGSSAIALEAVDLISGERLWSREFPQAKYHLHRRNTLASSTPAADERHVFAAWSDPEHTVLKCFDHAGNEVWTRDFGTWQSQHGFGTSPKIFGSMVLLFNSQQAEQLDPGQQPGRSRMIAVDRSTGDTVWETPLSTTRTCYGVPAIFRPEGDGPTQIIDANTGNGMFGLDAETGELLWSKRVFEMRCCSTPLIIDDIAIASSGSGGGGNHLVAVRIPGPGEEPQQVYRVDRAAPYVPTPVLKDGRLFIISDDGIASCVDARTGDVKWKNRVRGTFGASPIVVGEKMLVINLDGEATILRASDSYEKLGEVDLGGYVGATPAYANGRLLLRVGTELRCLAPGTI